MNQQDTKTVEELINLKLEMQTGGLVTFKGNSQQLLASHGGISLWAAWITRNSGRGIMFEISPEIIEFLHGMVKHEVGTAKLYNDIEFQFCRG